MNDHDLNTLSKADLISRIHSLTHQLAETRSAQEDAELLAETITEHATELENQLYKQNTTMSSYIQQVGKVIEAAIAVENNTFNAEHLQDVLPRTDELGLLARVFRQMVDTVKAREFQIAQAKNQLAAVLDAVPGSIAWINRQGIYIGVNRHLANLVGLAPHDFIGQSIGFSGSSPEFEQFVEQFLSSTLDSTAQEVPVWLDGRTQHYLLVAQKYDAGEGVVLVGIDISERRAAERKLAQQRNQFARFVPMEYLQFLRRDSILNVELGEHVSTNMAIMFSDIRAFTTLAERMSPQDSFNFVNHYLSIVSPAIRDRNGFIVKYMGDGIMAAFPKSADDAVAGGIAHLEQVQAFNTKQEGSDQISVGIGIHFGHVMVGIVGESGRMQGDAFSDSVNLAARLEGLTKVYGVSLLISEAVLEQLSAPIAYHIRFIDRAVVKGRHEAIAVYEVFDGEPETIRQLKHETQDNFELAISCYAEGNLLDALTYFTQVLERNPQDRTAQMYLQRVSLLLQQGLPENWDGTWQFTQK
ncbi:MAG: adenylate/guanylate cyclase domain-containing protein [Cyanobacteria bacterium P01_G01_bin.54]